MNVRRPGELRDVCFALFLLIGPPHNVLLLFRTFLTRIWECVVRFTDVSADSAPPHRETRAITNARSIRTDAERFDPVSPPLATGAGCSVAPGADAFVTAQRICPAIYSVHVFHGEGVVVSFHSSQFPIEGAPWTVSPRGPRSLVDWAATYMYRGPELQTAELDEMYYPQVHRNHPPEAF